SSDKVDGREQMAGCKRRHLYATFCEKRVGSDNKAFGSILRKRSEGHFNLATRTRIKNLDLTPCRRCRFFNVLDRTFGGNRVGPINKQCKTAGARDHFLQYA